MNRNHWMRILAVACCAVVAGCGGADDGGRPDGTMVVSDSAGVRLVDLGPFSGLELPERSSSVTAEMGTTAGAELFHVSAARLLENGELAVGNAGTFEVLYFGGDGALIRRAGGEGDGPGEFRAITSLHAAGDTLVVYDVRQGRLTELDGAGGVLGTRPLAPPSDVVDLLPLALGDGGRVVAVHGESRLFAPSGVRRDTVPLMVIDASSAVDTIGLWPGRQWSFTSHERGTLRTEVVFGYALEASGRSGYAVVGSTDRLELTVVDGRGDPVMRVRWDEPARRVSDDEAQRWREARMAGAPDDLPAVIREALEGGPHNDVLPAFAGLLLDADRRIWVGSMALYDSPDRSWTVLESDGTPAFQVVLPVKVRPLDAAGDRLVVLRRSDLGEEIVVILRLDPPPAQR